MKRRKAALLAVGGSTDEAVYKLVWREKTAQTTFNGCEYRF